MSKGSSQNNKSDELMEMEIILKEKYDRERLEEWKKLMPMPEDNPEQNNSLLKRIIGIVIGMTTIAIVIFFLMSNSNPTNLADKYLSNTAIAALDGQNARGDSDKAINTNQLEFASLVIKIKEKGKITEGDLQTLSGYTVIKNKYQAEALWFSALGNIKLQHTAQAIKELERLKAISSYKKDEVEMLLSALEQ